VCFQCVFFNFIKVRTPFRNQQPQLQIINERDVKREQLLHVFSKASVYLKRWLLNAMERLNLYRDKIGFGEIVLSFNLVHL